MSLKNTSRMAIFLFLQYQITIDILMHADVDAIMQSVRSNEHERAYVNKCEILLPLLPKCEAGVDRKPTG